MLTQAIRRLNLTVRRHPLLPFLLAATLALDLVLVAGADAWSPHSQGELWYVWYGLVLSTIVAQAGLLGLWAGQPRHTWPVALVAALIGSLVLPCLWNWGSDPSHVEVSTVLAIYIAAIAVVIALIQLGRSLLVPNRRTQPVRFSVGTLIAVTTIGAIAAALARQAQAPRDDLLSLVSLFGCWGLIPVGAYIVARWTNKLVLAATSIALATIISCALFAFLIDSTLDPQFYLPTLWQGIIIGAWTLGLKVRPQRGRRKAIDEPPTLSLHAPDDQAAAE